MTVRKQGEANHHIVVITYYYAYYVYIFVMLFIWPMAYPTLVWESPGIKHQLMRYIRSAVFHT